MTAYQLIDAVRPQGISAPPTVYRALERLIGEGHAHRLESLNAFVACTHEQAHSGVTIFMICEECGEADEISDQGIATLLQGCAHKIGFRSHSTTVEIRGHCTACADQPI